MRRTPSGNPHRTLIERCETGRWRRSGAHPVGRGRAQDGARDPARARAGRARRRSVDDGDEALSRARDDYDAIVLDVMLPGTDGFAVCRELRTRERWAPVLMLTARDAVEDRIRGLDAGADDYLVKPFAFGELLARLRALVRRGRPSARPCSRSVTWCSTRPPIRSRAPAPVELSRQGVRAARVPDAPSRRGARRAASSNTCGTSTTTGFSNVVDVYVGYLRRKLEAVRASVHPHGSRRRLRGGRRMNLPIRVRLTVWYVALLAVSWCLGGFLVASAPRRICWRIDESSTRGGADRARARAAGARVSSGTSATRRSSVSRRASPARSFSARRGGARDLR